MSDHSGFRILFRNPLTAAGASDDSGVLTAFINSTDAQWGLYWLSDEAGRSLQLGQFSDEKALKERMDRFIDHPETTPALALDSEQAQKLRTMDEPEQLPLFIGVFGTAFSGYLLKEDPVQEGMSDADLKLMLFYTADYRSELLGVLSPEEALKVMTNHYDNRRKRCMLC